METSDILDIPTESATKDNPVYSIIAAKSSMETSDILDIPTESATKDNPVYSIIPAKSSRAKCKHCQQLTTEGELVIFKTFKGHSHPMSQYFCLDCFFTKVMPKARNWGISVDDTTGNTLKYVGSCDQLVGFDELLDETTKASVIAMINTGNANKTKSKPASKVTDHKLFSTSS